MLSSSHRFHGLHALNFAYKRGETVRGPALQLKYAINNRRSGYRAAVVISKKVSKSAVVRNRIRRRIYEELRQQADTITKPYDLIFVVYGVELATIDATALQALVGKQLQQAGVSTAMI